MRLSSFLSVVLGGLSLATTAVALSDISDVTISSARALVKRDSIVDDILTEIENTATCDACQALLVVLKALADLGNDAFVTVITDICVDLGLEDEDVCVGSIALEGPILAHDLRQMTIGTRTSVLFCLSIFGLCQWPDVEAYNVTMTAKPNTTRPAPSGESPIQIVHISDIHVDRFYETGSSYNCTKNICCRPYTTDAEPGNTDYPAGEYGNVNCDSPVSLEESLYAAIVDLVPDRSFTIFTGDVVEGAVWNVSDTEVGTDLNDAYANMNSASIGTVYGVVGNHDSCPVNSFPPAAVDTTMTSQWVYNNLSTDWSSWIGSTASTEVADNYGSYSTVDSSGLRLISFNTNFWYKDNFWNFEKTMERDPSGLLAWLVDQLESAESAGERVWLMGHMPPGASDMFHDQSQYFDQIVERFDATIAAMFYGHTHKDEFEIAYSDWSDQSSDTATMVAYIAPALTPTSGNPTFRVYSVDPVTFGILDFTVYYANLSSPTYQDGPTWEVLYSVKDSYGPLVDPPVTNTSAELTPAFWHSVTDLFESNDTVFQEYYNRKYRDYYDDYCDSDCKTAELCQLRATNAQYNCLTISPGINLKKRDSDEAHVHIGDSCEGSTAAPIISSFAASGISSFAAALASAAGEDFMQTVIPANYTTGNVTYVDS